MSDRQPTERYVKYEYRKLNEVERYLLFTLAVELMPTDALEELVPRYRNQNGQ